MKKLIKQGKWDGREWKVWTGQIHELREELPNFTITNLRIGKGVNKYKDLIVRDPLKISLGDVVDDDAYLPIPIDAVRKQYVGTKWENFSKKTAMLGYGLVQHQDLLNSVLDKLKEFSDKNKGSVGISRISSLTDTEKIETKLETTTYGARMHLEFVVPNFKYSVRGATYNLKVVCRNSVDKHIAVNVIFYLCPEQSLSLQHQPLENEEIPDIIFWAFYSQHKPDELKDNAIETKVYEKLAYIGSGNWVTQTIDRDFIMDNIDVYVSKRIIYEKDAKQIRAFLQKEPKDVNMFDFILALRKLYGATEQLNVKNQKKEKVFRLINEIDKEIK